MFPTVTSHILFQVTNFCQGGVLATGTKEVTEGFERDATVAALVVQRERFLVVCRSLRDGLRISHGDSGELSGVDRGVVELIEEEEAAQVLKGTKGVVV